MLVNTINYLVKANGKFYALRQWRQHGADNATTADLFRKEVLPLELQGRMANWPGDNRVLVPLAEFYVQGDSQPLYPVPDHLKAETEEAASYYENGREWNHA